MKVFYGPYVRSSAEDKWHWKKECPDYPGLPRIESMISTAPLSSLEACLKCLQLEGDFLIEEERMIKQNVKEENSDGKNYKKNF